MHNTKNDSINISYWITCELQTMRFNNGQNKSGSLRANDGKLQSPQPQYKKSWLTRLY